MKFGLTSEQHKYIQKIVVEPLKYRQANVWCYGSRARGDYKPFSDLDLMVETSSDVTSLLSQIREQLENGNFPFKIDLVELKDFADAYTTGFNEDKILFE